MPNSAGSELFPFPLEESIPLELYLRCKASDPKEDELDSGQEVNVSIVVTTMQLYSNVSRWLHRKNLKMQ